MTEEVKQRVLAVWHKFEPRAKEIVAKNPTQDVTLPIYVDGVFDAVEYRNGRFERIKVFVADEGEPTPFPFTVSCDKTRIEFIDLIPAL